MNMKQNPFARPLAAALMTAALVSYAEAPVEEIDLSATDDSAEGRERGDRVVITDSEQGLISVDFNNDTLASVLEHFRRVTHKNILNGDETNLTRRVSARLFDVQWESALQSILGLVDFKMKKSDNIWYVLEKTPEDIKNATRYFVLKHASAVDLANLFNGVSMATSYYDRYSIRGSSTVKDPGLLNDGAGSKDGDAKREIKSAIAGRAKATAFPNTNTLVLTGPEANLVECEQIVNELDRPVTQVYIEARFIELSTEALHKLGIKWDQLESWGASVKNIKAGYQSSDGSAANYGIGLTQKSVNNNENESVNDNDSQNANQSESSSTAGANKSSATSKTTAKSDNATYAGLFPSAIGDAAGAGATAADMAWENASAFSGQLSADDFRLALSAFEQMQEGKLFSNPRIIVANGKEARVDMTTKEPYVEMESHYNSATVNNLLEVSSHMSTIPGTDRNLFAGEAFFSYGITLSVKPRVSQAGLIAVEVVPSISELKKYVGPNRDDAGNIISSQQSTSYPVINMKSISTEFTMKNGATAVIGGLTQTQEKDVDSGIPYLRKIPWIGPKLFGWQSRQKVQTEILVLVTVGIANPETLRKDAGLPTNAVLGREYVEGRRFEPGERPNALKNIQTVDTRSMDEIREDPYRLKDDENAFSDDAQPVKPAEPVKPAAEPVQPAQPAAEPAAEPVQPAQPVAEPVAGPVKPVAEPVQPVAEPVATPVTTAQPQETQNTNRCRRRKR